MGYFFSLFSLSKSGTNTALNCSEVALLLFGVILVIGVVGEEVERWEHRKKLFVALVIVGVAGELFADGGIFLFSHQLQVISDTEIAVANKNAGDAKTSAEGAARAAGHATTSAAAANSLATDAESKTKGVARQTVKLEAKAHELGKQIDAAMARTRPRVYRMDDKKFVEALKGVKPCNVEVLYKREDDEAYELASKIVRLLGSKDGLGWNVSGPRPLKDRPKDWEGAVDIPPSTLFTGGVPFGGELMVRDPRSVGEPSSGHPLWALEHALAASGIHFRFITQDSSLADDTVRIVVLSQFD